MLLSVILPPSIKKSKIQSVKIIRQIIFQKYYFSFISRQCPCKRNSLFGRGYRNQTGTYVKSGSFGALENAVIIHFSDNVYIVADVGSLSAEFSVQYVLAFAKLNHARSDKNLYTVKNRKALQERILLRRDWS